jgi:hypothetical protein
MFSGKILPRAKIFSRRAPAKQQPGGRSRGQQTAARRAGAIQ